MAIDAKTMDDLEMNSLRFSVRIRYQVLDESTLPRHPAELTVTIRDTSGVQIHAWNVGYLQRKRDDSQGKV